MDLGKATPLLASNKLKRKLQPLHNKKFIVGISYFTLKPNSAYRMPPQKFWHEIFNACPEVAFINLQENSKTDHKKRAFLYNHKNLYHIDEVDLYNDIEGLADLICSMDFVVSISNYVAHLTGRLAKPFALVTQKFCNCRWILANDPTAWYPTCKLIRSNECGSWSNVKTELIKSIRGLH